ncbi:MAG: transposase [Candidatus Kapaibacterium sp.]
MAKQRRRYTSEFKAKVAMEALKGQRSIHELASQFELHPNEISEWKKELHE